MSKRNEKLTKKQQRRKQIGKYLQMPFFVFAVGLLTAALIYVPFYELIVNGEWKPAALVWGMFIFVGGFIYGDHLEQNP